MSATRRFLAPAKLNLALRVVGKRADGYHLLQSVMVFFPWYDELEITTQPQGLEFVCEPEVTVAPEENLVLRAAASLQKLANREVGARLHLRKRIPAGAGLGGGSSDAATTLLALDRMWGLHSSRERLMALGLALGADVPFFLGGVSALAGGVGEELTPLPGFPEAELVVVFPGVSLATSRVFRALNGRFAQHVAPLALPATVEGLPDLLENDLQPPAMALEPAIGQAAAALEQAGALRTLMSGSGSSVFGIFADAGHAAAATQRLRADHARWRIAAGRIFHHHPFAREWQLV
ncbi:MAG: 4-(cytidine 5'-diphospho)-2-C-methyl-D-erythritol kinase [Magnetococcales bacterium]|nr:4-(cytidine 5'-diphospho)-2-C-methyl-D-erythritol kinase [Magnetococcales bacterium]